MAEQKHHYIPEFYLKQWSSSDGRLVEFCRRHFNKVRARRTHPGGTGYVRGLYSLRNSPVALKDIFENNYMMLADGLAARSLQIMLQDHVVPTGENKNGWARFMVSLLYRTPEGVARSYEMVRKYYDEEVLTDDFRERYASLKGLDDPSSPEEYLRIHGAGMKERTTISHLMDIIENDRVREKIIGMKWHLGEMRNLRHELLTGDRPIIMTNGIALEQSHMVMPLSPRHIFIATNTDEEAEKIKALSADGEIVKRMNDRMVRQARKFVFASNSNQLRFVENRLGEKAACSPFE